MILSDNVMGKIKESEWFSPVDYSVKYIKQFTFSGLFITKNNRELYGCRYSCAVIPFKDIEDRSKEDIDNLMTARRDAAYRLIVTSLEDILRRRTGIRGHRGYFRIVDIKPKE